MSVLVPWMGLEPATHDADAATDATICAIMFSMACQHKYLKLASDKIENRGWGETNPGDSEPGFAAIMFRRRICRGEGAVKGVTGLLRVFGEVRG